MGGTTWETWEDNVKVFERFWMGGLDFFFFVLFHDKSEWRVFLYVVISDKYTDNFFGN